MMHSMAQRRRDVGLDVEFNRWAEESAAVHSRDAVRRAKLEAVDVGDGVEPTTSLDLDEMPSSAEVVRIPHFLPHKRGKERVFAANKEWEGVVLAVGDTHISTQLWEVSTPQADVVDMMEIPIGDVPRKDQHLLVEGAIFRYLIGYAKNYGGTLSIKRHVYVRRGRAIKDQPDRERFWTDALAKLRG